MSDLRRRSRREHAERLVELAEYLLPADRALIEAVYRDGLSVAAYVRRQRVDGFAVWTERSARRRIRRLIERLASPRVSFVLAVRQDWAPMRRRVAMAVVVQGVTLREAARSLGLSLHSVRRHMEAVETIFSESREAAIRLAPIGRSR